jgi:hypothetical protein
MIRPHPKLAKNIVFNAIDVWHRFNKFCALAARLLGWVCHEVIQGAEFLMRLDLAIIYKTDKKALNIVKFRQFNGV